MAQIPATRSSQGGQLAARREHPLERLQRDFDTLFNRLMGGWLSPFGQDVGSVRLWDFDVSENDQEVVVRAEVPGFEENELDVQLNNDVLTIKAEKEQKGNGREEYRSYQRSVTLPPGIDAEAARATYRNGVLELHFPRAAGAQPRHIKVEGEKGAAGRPGTRAAGAQAPSEQGGGTTASRKAGK
jgi:HSP20 family protein